MIKRVNFTGNVIDHFILEIKNIIDNDFMLKNSNVVIFNMLLPFEDIFDTEKDTHRIALVNNEVITAVIPNEFFYIYNYDISYKPYESLFIRFNKK